MQGEWYTNFMTNLAGNGKQDMDLFYKVKSAANFMDINPLLEMICLWLTFKITELKEAEPVRLKLVDVIQFLFVVSVYPHHYFRLFLLLLP